MTRVLLLVLLLAMPALAAPPPREPESSKLKRIWGEALDVDKDCTFSVEGEKLKIVVPGKNHLFRAATHDGGQSQADNAPRTSRTVSGDFTLSVEFTSSQPTEDKANAGTFAGVGVYVRADNSCCAMALHHTADANGAPKTAQFRLMGRKTNSSTSGTRQAGKDDVAKPVAVRLVREGNRVQTSYSTNGKTWKTMWSYDGDFPGEVTVGVYAENTGGKGYDAVFEGLKIDTGEKK